MVRLSEDPTWEKTDMGWNIVPWGCRKLLEWIDARYSHPPIYITENGCAVPGNTRAEFIQDTQRIEYIKSYLRECKLAMNNGVDLRGYFVWSLLDNFEWELGYKMRFGLHYVDFKTGERTPKKSAAWYKGIIKNHSLQE
jgi:beta-glucosidase